MRHRQCRKWTVKIHNFNSQYLFSDFSGKGHFTSAIKWQNLICCLFSSNGGANGDWEVKGLGPMNLLNPHLTFLSVLFFSVLTDSQIMIIYTQKQKQNF